MIDFLFFVKTFILTVAIVLAMQIQIGDRTLETHAMSWMQSSTVASPLNSVARGASKMVHDVTQSVWYGVHHNVKKKEDSQRGFFSRWTQSGTAQKTKAQDGE